ncbi:phosphotransferase [Streptomyces shenzhenensis]|uniref:phosphotransferase n=1 Tax=Streptomyces shenzhenensis TaxID=943815 RepID=UPI00340A6779
MATRRRPRRTAAPGDADRGRAAAQGAHLGADRAPATARRAGCRRPGRLPDRTAPAGPGEWTGPALWLHGDLHPANVLTADGTSCGVIDFGDLCAGDPACDLAASWVLLPAGAADRFHDTCRPAPDAAALRRARGWAVLQALSGILIGEACRSAPGTAASGRAPPVCGIRTGAVLGLPLRSAPGADATSSPRWRRVRRRPP